MKELKKELPRFLVAGFSAVGTDFIIYYFLLGWLSYSPAKAVSFLSGTVVAYLINKYWTFGKKEKSCREIFSFLILYSGTLLANVGVNRFVLWFLAGNFPYRVALAFLAATGTSTILNFIGQKWWVFADRRSAIENERFE